MRRFPHDLGSLCEVEVKVYKIEFTSEGPFFHVCILFRQLFLIFQSVVRYLEPQHPKGRESHSLLDARSEHKKTRAQVQESVFFAL
jgi:hypothetical protein